MKISVIGAGYVGLVTGACLASMGNEVSLVEVDMRKVESINNNIFSIYEEGLPELMKGTDIVATTDYNVINGAGIIFICTGTPSNPDGSMSLEQIKQAAGKIGDLLKTREDYCVVAVKSTVVPGTTDEVVIPILERSGKKAGRDFGVCMSPEFLREGRAVYDFMHPARVIIGEFDRRSGDTLLPLYEQFKAPILRTDIKTAEMIKLASNTFLANKISFINEIGNICKRMGIDVFEVAKGMALDERIGNKFLNAGVGFGGSCLPKDLRALIARATEYGYNPGILKEVLCLNDKQALIPVDLLKKHIPLNGATVGLLGLAFKPGTDDIRDSRAILVAGALLKEGASVLAYDPMAANNFKNIFPEIKYSSIEDVMKSDAVVILTEWEEFSALDYRGKIVIDGRMINKAREARIYEGVCW
ncbi:MAG: UDP-glucose/GDP-mannose dehydrogenase family protein [Dehalococcoidia bacterium]|nr:UDP-glucose/GDP-mannose dehydrogenase family protein [Dehalococcoidia bacterium]